MLLQWKFDTLICTSVELWNISPLLREDCTYGRDQEIGVDISCNSYILVKHRFRNSVKDVQTLPGADIDCDHNLLVAKMCTRLKKIIRFQKRRAKWGLE